MTVPPKENPVSEVGSFAPRPKVPRAGPGEHGVCGSAMAMFSLSS